MRLRDPDLLKGYMDLSDFSQARLARAVGCSRQFIHMLLSGEKNSCSEPVGGLIEDALSLRRGTLFIGPTQEHSGAGGGD